MPILIVYVLLSPIPTNAVPPRLPPDETITRGLFRLYNLQYDKAHDIFESYTKTHPHDAAGPFYMTAVDWWQLSQQFDSSLPLIEARFENDFQLTIKTSDAVYNSTKDSHQKALACLYGGGAEGLKGRWLVSKKQWMNAFFLGKDGHRRLVESLKHDPQLYDAYMGLGIYDYYTDIYRGLIGAFAKVFIRGNRKRGLEELQIAIDRGTYSEGEARLFLVEIYTFEEGKPALALALVKILREQYPDSPAMHLAEITTLYSMQEWVGVEAESKIYLEKSEREIPYYKKEGVRPALYCMGVAQLFGRKDAVSCLENMQKILDMGIDSNRWVTFAYLRRGEVHDVRGERALALADYQTVLSRHDFWGSQTEARERIKKPFAL